MKRIMIVAVAWWLVAAPHSVRADNKHQQWNSGQEQVDEMGQHHRLHPHVKLHHPHVHLHHHKA